MFSTGPGTYLENGMTSLKSIKIMSVSHTLIIFHMTSHTKHPVRVGPVGGVGVTARRQAIALGIGGHPWDPLTLQPATHS